MTSHRPQSPAGGRGALRGTFRAWSRQGIPLKLVGSFLTANKVGGFDCPGCAFPDKVGHPLVDSCEQGQKAIAWEMTRKSVGAEFFDGKTPAQLRALGDFDLEFQGRLTTPVLYDAAVGTYRAIDWDEAYAVAARELRALPPQSVAFYASGRSSNEAAFLWQLAARGYGSPHLPDSSNFCHEPSGYALKQSIGTGKGTCTLEDFEHAELFIVIGQNPASNHPRMMGALYEAKKRGATILAINPLRERGFTHFSDPKNVSELARDKGIAVADAIYQVTIGGDFAALKGVMKALLEMERAAPGTVFDQAFIARHTEGFDALIADLDACAWDTLVDCSGLPEAQMREIATHYARAQATMITWCMGLTHHPDAVATIQQVVNLLLLRGNIGRPGTGAMPVRGHSNVQGDRTMGATSQVTDAWLDNIEAAFPGVALCRDAGRDAAGVIDGLFDGNVRALLSLGGNFGVAAPDSPRVLEALERCRFTLHIATKLNRTHCHPGEIGLLLPTLGRTDRDLRPGGEQCISTEDSSSTVRASRGVQAPISELQRSEPAIVAELAQAIGIAHVPWRDFTEDYAAIRDRIERCQQGVTEGFDRYNDRLLQDGRFMLPNAAAHRQWNTRNHKARFMAHALHDDTPVQQARRTHGTDALTLMTMRAHDQFNTTVYSGDDRYRGVEGDRRVVFLNAEDLAKRGLQDGDRVDIECLVDDGHERRVYAFTARAWDIPAGCCAAYYPEASGLIAASVYSAGTRTPLYKEMPVRISPCPSP
ncbi:Oxidoreductase alpha (Molybdopterin) subunit [Lysobacter dokdonensis DS-58]|uniref:Oxidoreductase alpha (Molybdopterin) subunit n=1 Tax=Lysobacter dokdonensis DS-58 TaxID=1300345 RepID=A0A0A2WKV7_9GAMM|nr:FdhF/YdeP family oxidoreductase [Lysobacter dokdonensis]KGQ20448.1 Oxidoreductase alpha (Molybdopterin) subunit [Lysobacter dokdonensis DS-58]